MSTKIFTGFRVLVGTMPEFYVWYQNVQTELVAAQRRYWLENLSKYGAFYSDERRLGIVASEGNESRSPLSRLFNEFVDEREKDSWRNLLDTRGWVDIYFGPDGCIGYVNGRESGAFFDIILNQPNTEDFSYWDNTDKPDAVDDSEWEHRRAVWHWAFKQPRNLSLQIHPEFPDWPQATEIVEYQPTFAERVRQAADRMRGYHIPKDVLAEKDFASIMEWMQGNEGQSLLKKYKEEVKLKLPKELEAEDYL
jgi:hypothetical protein